MDIAVVVNLHARRGSQRVARACRDELPDARVLASRSLDEAVDFARGLCAEPPDLVLSAGGDGTAIAMLNAMRGTLACHDGGLAPGSPAIGVLPLGTGNGWARATGAPRWRAALAHLGRAARAQRRLPRKRFDLVEVGGTLAHFAGTGWDAEIIDDFHAQKTGWGVLPESRRNGLAGYMQGLFTRTIPRSVAGGPLAELELLNTGEDALTVDDHGRVVPVPGGEHGRMLYCGPASVCGAGTSQEWGFGFRAFPFAGVVPRRFCLRVYGGTALEATFRMRSLWKGTHPLAKMHTWLLTSCRGTFSRAVPFQVGGDRYGHRADVEYRLASEQVDVLDWRRLTLD